MARNLKLTLKPKVLTLSHSHLTPHPSSQALRLFEYPSLNSSSLSLKSEYPSLFLPHSHGLTTRTPLIFFFPSHPHGLNSVIIILMVFFFFLFSFLVSPLPFKLYSLLLGFIKKYSLLLILIILLVIFFFFFLRLHLKSSVEDEEDETENDDNDTSGGSFGSHDDIDFNFLHNKWGLGLKT